MELKEKHRRYYTPPECVRYRMLAEKMLGGSSGGSSHTPLSEGAGGEEGAEKQTDIPAKSNSFTNSQSHSEHDPGTYGTRNSLIHYI